MGDKLEEFKFGCFDTLSDMGKQQLKLRKKLAGSCIKEAMRFYDLSFDKKNTPTKRNEYLMRSISLGNIANYLGWKKVYL